MRRKFLLVLLVISLAACGQQAPAASPTPAATATPIPSPTPTPEPVLAAGADGNPWWTDTVFYEIFVRSFADSDGDGIGDLQGLIAKLDYLNDGDPATTTDLGVRGIWLMPIHPSPSYHGYDVTDYFMVNPEYGSLEDFQQLMEEAHKRGIRVIMDLVVNHTSLEHPWFLEALDPQSEKRDWYIWSNTDPGYRGPWNAPAWHAANGAYYYGVFWSGMPDLNMRNPEVTGQMNEIARFWLEEQGVDGFRVDGAKHLIENGEDQQINTPETKEWFEQFRVFYKAINPRAFAVGEVRDTIFAAAPYARGDGLDAVFDFDLAQAIINGVNGEDGQRITNAVNFSLSKYEPGSFATFLTNHDDPRVMVSFQDNRSKMKAAATIYLTGPGVPFIYYGEEIGMKGIKPDELIRTPMHWSAEEGAGFTSGTPWQSLRRDYREVNVAAQADDPGSLLAHYRALVQLRSQLPALRVGEYAPVSSSEGAVYAAARLYQGQAVLTLLNLSDETLNGVTLSAELPGLDGTYSLRPVLGDGEYGELTISDGQLTDAVLTGSLPAYFNLVLVLEKK